MNTIIEKIKSWVNQRIDMWSKNREEMIKQECYTLADDSTCRIGELTDLLSFLDTLEKSEKPMNQEGLEEEEYEQIKQKVCSDCPSHKDDYCGYVKRQLQRKCNYLSDVMYGYELGRQSKPTTAEGLEEELVKYIGYPEENLDGKWKKKEVEDIARHFAKWGAEHLDK